MFHRQFLTNAQPHPCLLILSVVDGHMKTPSVTVEVTFRLVFHGIIDLGYSSAESTGGNEICRKEHKHFMCISSSWVYCKSTLVSIFSEP